jgi:hypothetical protein
MSAIASWFRSPLCRLVGGNDESFITHALLEIIFGQKSGLASSVSHEDTALLGALNKALVVASDAITNRDKTELFFVKDVPVFRGEFQQLFREAIVVLLLLEGVVECRVAEILLAVGNEELLKL